MIQVEFLAGVLNNLVKTKKPVVLVTTKNDEANEVYVKEAERLVQRKEYKGAILLVETSAHENINVDQAFIALAQLIDRTKGRPKVKNYIVRGFYLKNISLTKKCLLICWGHFRFCRLAKQLVRAKSS
jgi:GTPase SAR1 family protein